MGYSKWAARSAEPIGSRTIRLDGQPVGAGELHRVSEQEARARTCLVLEGVRIPMQVDLIVSVAWGSDDARASR